MSDALLTAEQVGRLVGRLDAAGNFEETDAADALCAHDLALRAIIAYLDRELQRLRETSPSLSADLAAIREALHRWGKVLEPDETAVWDSAAAALARVEATHTALLSHAEDLALWEPGTPQHKAALGALRVLAVSPRDTPSGQATSGEPGDGASAVVAEEGRDV